MVLSTKRPRNLNRSARALSGAGVARELRLGLRLECLDLLVLLLDLPRLRLDLPRLRLDLLVLLLDLLESLGRCAHHPLDCLSQLVELVRVVVESLIKLGFLVDGPRSRPLQGHAGAVVVRRQNGES